MRDPARLEQLITLLAGLDHIHFNLDVDVSYLDMSTYSHQDTSLPPDLPFLTKCNSTMTASITSSLASPVDSGVALLDSDADATSVSEATLNGGDNLSLREDDSTLAELDDVKFTPTPPTPLVEPLPVMDDSASLTKCNEASKHHCFEADYEELSYIQKQSSQESVPAVANTTNKKNDADTENALLHDAASDFVRKAVFHAAFITKSANCGDTKDDTPIITVTKAQCPEESVNNTKSLDEYNCYLPFCEPETAIEVYEVCPIMTASDIANQNVEPVDTRAPSFGRISNIGRRKTGGVTLKNDIKCDTAQLSEDIKFNYTQCNGQEENVNSTSTDCDEIVFRRQRKKRNKSEVKVKRVSFHEDLIVGTTEDGNSVKCNAESISDSKKKNDSISDFSASFLPPNPIIKKDVIRGRYSWCAEGDAPYVSQRSNTRSEVFLSTNSDQSCNYPPFNTSNNEFSNSTPNSPHNCQHINKSVNSSVYNGRNELSYQSKPESCTETLGRIEPPVKLFPDRFFPQKDHSLFDDGNDTVLQMDALIQSTPPQSDFKKITSKLKSLPVTERGVPEGQEDPQRSCSTQHLCSNVVLNYSSYNLKKFPSVGSSIDCFSDLDSLRSDPDDRNKFSKTSVMYGSNNKVSQLDRFGGRRHSNVREYKKSLLSRFLKSVTVKKFVEKKARIAQPARSLYIKGVKVDTDMHREYSENLDSEIQKGQMEIPPSYITSIPVDSNLEMIFKSQIFVSDKEHVDKVFRVRSCYFVGEVATPLLVLLTDVNLYITGSKMNHAYCNHLILPYVNLDSILVGPNSHCLMLLSANDDVQFTITTGDSEMTSEIISCIEIRMRNIGLSPAAVRVLELEDMKALKHSIRKPADMSEDDLLHYYSLIHLQDDQHSLSSTPLGPTMEGHLMFRPATHTPLQPWTPAYCVLKAGVLYMFSDPDHQLPKRVLMLRNGHCKGCQRLKDRRPHTFAILLQGSGVRSLQFAAADEYQASDWLQAFIQAAAGVHEGEGVETTPCSLIVTSRHVLTCHEEFPSGKARALAVANIADITAFRAEHSWCVLEFACREVHESSGDWVLYFASVKEMDKFQESLQELWPQLKQTEFPLSAIVDENQRRRCLETGHVLAQVWEHLVPFSKIK